MNRVTWAVVVNVFVPGSGLILLRREWLGLALAVLFAVLVQLVVIGALVVPLDVVSWVVIAAASGAIVIWSLSQWLVIARARLVSSPQLAHELARLREQGRAALDRDDLADGHRTLLVAINMNDEDAACLMLWAELMDRMGRSGAARRCWKRVLRLTGDSAIREAAREALTEARQVRAGRPRGGTID